MRSRRTLRFREILEKLPKDVREQADAAYELFETDPYHPSLHFKRIRREVYSARVGKDYRVLGRREEKDLIIWFWIGPHDEYDKLIDQL